MPIGTRRQVRPLAKALVTLPGPCKLLKSRAGCEDRSYLIATFLTAGTMAQRLIGSNALPNRKNRALPSTKA